MPLRKGSPVGDTIRELHGGKTYKNAVKKRGKKAAQRQAVAIAMKNKRAGKSQKRASK